jgi:zinc protease
MKITTKKFPKFELAEVIKENARTAYLLITLDDPTQNSSESTVTRWLYSELLKSGAGIYSREGFAFRLKELGSDIAVSESSSRVSILLTALDTNLKATLELLEIMLTKPAFKPAELKRAKQTLAENLKVQRENAKAISVNEFKNKLYPKNSRNYTSSLSELLKSIDVVSLNDIKKLHKVIQNTIWITSVGGSAKSNQLSSKLIDLLTTENTPITADFVVNNFPVKKPEVVINEVKSKQNIEFAIGGQLPLKITDHDLPAFVFGLSVLGKWGGFSGRLMSTVREKEGLTYGIYARTEGSTINETGHWRIMTFFSPKDAIKGITSTLREINKITKEGITESEFKRFKVILKTQEALTFDSLGATTNSMHAKLVAGLDFENYQNFQENLHSCTKKQINEALKKYLGTESLVISAAGPTQAILKELKKVA